MGDEKMQMIFKQGRVEIWAIDGEFYVYGWTRDPYVCPSLDMARAVAANALA